MQIDRIPRETAGNQPFVYQYGGDERCMPWGEAYAIKSLGVLLHPLTQATGRRVCHAKATSDGSAIESRQDCFEELWRYIWLASEQQRNASADVASISELRSSIGASECPNPWHRLYLCVSAMRMLATSRRTGWASPAPRLRENPPQHKINYKARGAAADQPRQHRRVQALVSPHSTMNP
ncbi:hypothetical protein HKBW3S03_00794 [Candidatus Hakubella thermalkaliphila]|uniref:Uncharacterized protein n=1 Tax=Candidatus Hakubella thermalkaliphila TaxID=2754717 RepID=A0A6V8NG68_9ACTN|nr:hypothetical protein HKBW3S03_00794 [Candidatus Hakubella thermalkaliphila]GFP22627.1 hypothetical protein HKBW3S09_00095 [Candidatus Hakubella thermalkaliphila]GFP30581.1 hypothetical protein HKBW3S34_01501 [Candidatus Hakubella thermalkaliphila]